MEKFQTERVLNNLLLYNGSLNATVSQLTEINLKIFLSNVKLTQFTADDSSNAL